MAKVEIVLDYAGIQALLKSAEIAAACETEAEKKTRATGMDYVSDVYMGRTRVNAGGYQEGANADDKSDAGRTVRGYYRKGQDGKIIYVQSYRRTK